MVRTMRRMMCLLTALLILLAAAAPGALASSYKAYINTRTKIYRLPYTTSESMTVSGGMGVYITDMRGDWAKIYRSGNTAFIPLKYLTLAEPLKGYITTSTLAYRYASTSSDKAGPLPVNTPLYVIGREGSFFRIQNTDRSITCYVPMSCVGTSKVSTTPSLKDQVVVMDWFDGGSDVLARGEYGKLYDIETGVTINVKRMGGTNHADLEPATAEDTARLKSIAGGAFSWDSRAVILIANGKYVACAINTMPHGDQTIYNNDYDGQFCLHMINSRTHGSDSVNELHQQAIKAAYDWAH